MSPDPSTNQPFFSIIIPTYNSADYILEAIEGVYAQDFKNYEVIVVDNASTDNTEELIKKYKQQGQHTNFNYIRHKENLERCVSRNTGIDESSGRYICFLDSDDYYKSNHLSTIYEFIKSRDFPKGMFYTNMFSLVGNELNKIITIEQESVNPPTYILEKDISIIPPQVCLHADILREFKFDVDLVMVEDTDLWIRTVNKYSLFHIDEYTVVHRYHDGNSTNLARFNAHRARLNGLKIIFKREYTNSIPKKSKVRAISRCYFGMAKFHLHQKQHFKMALMLLRSIGIYPKDPLTKHKVLLILSAIPGFRFIQKKS